MGTTNPATDKPVLHKRKAVRNLKDLARSSANPAEPEPSALLFSPGEQIPPKDPFRYENLKDNIGKRVGNYLFYSLEAYIYFSCSSNKEEKDKPAKIDKRSIFAAQKAEAGWKLHISVDPSQISAAWAIIYPILMENEISAKILAPDVLKRKPIEEVSGKQFTIYQFRHKHIDAGTWIKIMQRIENEFRQHGIGSGVIPPANKQIPNSEYFSYRNDTDLSGKYVSDATAQRYVDMHIHEDPQLLPYNLPKDNDPFEEVTLQINLDQNQIGSELTPI